jgi:hypothetical protein
MQEPSGTRQGNSTYFFFIKLIILAHFFALGRTKKPGFSGVPPFAFALQTAPGRFAPLQSLVPHGFFALCAIKFRIVTVSAVALGTRQCAFFAEDRKKPGFSLQVLGLPPPGPHGLWAFRFNPLRPRDFFALRATWLPVVSGKKILLGRTSSFAAKASGGKNAQGAGRNFAFVKLLLAHAQGIEAEISPCGAGNYRYDCMRRKRR